MNKKIDFENKVFRIIADTLGIKKERISLDSRIEELARDSIQLFELILAFEKEFRQKADYEDLINIETVGDIVKYVSFNYGKRH